MIIRIFLVSVLSVFILNSSGNAAECNGGGRYDDNNNGTVTDCRTGLIWLKNAGCNETSGGIGNSAGTLYWDEAIKWVAGLKDGICGLFDSSAEGAWRLPTKTEWMAMVENARRLGFTSPALSNGAGTGQWTADPSGNGIGGNTFNHIQTNYYWSFTANPASPATHAWIIDMTDGKVYSGSKGNLLPVWPVRAGQRGFLGSVFIQ